MFRVDIGHHTFSLSVHYIYGHDAIKRTHIFVHTLKTQSRGSWPMFHSQVSSCLDALDERLIIFAKESSMFALSLPNVHDIHDRYEKTLHEVVS